MHVLQVRAQARGASLQGDVGTETWATMGKPAGTELGQSQDGIPREELPGQRPGAGTAAPGGFEKQWEGW